MNVRLVAKIGWIGALLIVLLIPLALLDDLVRERKQRSEEVAREISASSGGAQRLVGPLLLIDQIRSVEKLETVTEQGTLRQVTRTERVHEQRVVLPRKVEAEVEHDIQRRARGPFEALLFRGGHRIRASFDAVDTRDEGVAIEAVRLVMGVGDARGIRAVTATVDGRALPLQPGTTLSWNGDGVHARVDESLAAAGFNLALDMDLAGAGAWHWVPAAGETELKVRSDWPHPSFQGGFLPDAPEIGEAGFAASWTISRFAGAGSEALRHCLARQDHCAALNQSFGFRLVEPVDRYLMTDRALKYALLFLGLVFGAVFFIEITAPLRVHPMQYAMVGLALAIFYLLLLALAEHIGFTVAYLSAATACCVLVVSYLAPALVTRTRQGTLGGLLVLLYGLLFGILNSEDMALLLGSIVLFALLAAVMLATRRLDWSKVGVARAEASGSSPS